MEHFEAFAEKAWDRFADCFSDDVRLYAGLGELHLQWDGIERLRAAHQAFYELYDEPKFDITHVTAQGDRVAIEYHWTVTERAGGQRVGIQRVEFFEVRDGKIAEVRVYSLTGFRLQRKDAAQRVRTG